MSKFFKVASITKKITLAILGLFLILFLLVHAGINLCMIRDDGGVWFSAAAHFMGTNYIVKVMEIVLFATLILHILLGITLQIANWKARPVRYKVTNKSKTQTGSKYMIYTGIMVLVFLCIHFLNFYFVKLGFVEGKYMVDLKELVEKQYDDSNMNREAFMQLFNPEKSSDGSASYVEMSGIPGEMPVVHNATRKEITDVFGPDFTYYEPDFYNIGRELFSNPVYSILYIILIIVLGIHLNHGFSSAFQTLGWASPKYTPIVKGLGTVYAMVVVVMFCIVPVFFLIY